MDKLTLNTDKRIRLGIWGLGRGMSFFKSCEALGLDVVAGCDLNAHMCDRFAEACTGAFVTADSDTFLRREMDAVVLATYCTEHAGDAIRALAAGKHVLSEVTAFHTMGEGVRLVEAVEKSGLVYQMAENYPFTKENLFLAEQYRRGLFGELQYAEFEYVHNCLKLAYTYIDDTPIVPGHAVHFWRSWFHFHYYNTHSLGPVMHITGLRPTRVTALPCGQGVPGFLNVDCQGLAPSLINLSNGAVMRNFMGATSNDGHSARLWGTEGAAERTGAGLRLKLGGGLGPSGKLKLPVEVSWPEGFGELAERTGHGGGDFWVLYYFAREIREGIVGPFSIYPAADCTSAGILAYRSAVEGGTPYDVPDFRDPAARERWRGDEFAQPRYDVEHGCFPAGADPEITDTFAATMSRLIPHAHTFNALTRWSGVADRLGDDELGKLRELRDNFLLQLAEVQAVYRQARLIVDAYPVSDGARVLTDMLRVGGEAEVLAGEFLPWSALRR